MGDEGGTAVGVRVCSRKDNDLSVFSFQCCGFEGSLLVHDAGLVHRPVDEGGFAVDEVAGDGSELAAVT